MSRCVRFLAFSLVLSMSCVLAACKPTTPSSPDSVPAAAGTATPVDDDTGSQVPTTLAEAAARLNPLASPKDQVVASIRKFMTVDSYHASMQVNGPQGAISNEIDFVAPDRFRMALAGVGTQTIIGDTMYMNMHGRQIKTALPKGTLSQWRDPARLDENEASMTVQAQGSDSIDGVATDKYLVHNTQPQPSDVVIWVGDAGLPVQMQVDSNAQGQATRTTIRYSRFNDPTLKVDPPQ